MQKNKTRFDRTVTASELNIGDRVLVRNVRLRGKHKIADKWESTVYVVVKKAENLPVYTLRPENADKPLRTLHRDLLLPCGYLPATSQIQPPPPTKSVKQISPTPEDEIESSDEDILPFKWYESLTGEPVHFTTTVDVPRLPAVTIPATEPQPDMSQAPSVTPESVTEPAPASTELKPQLQPESQEAIPKPEILSDSESELNSAPNSPAELSINLSPPASGINSPTNIAVCRRNLILHF